MVDNVGGFSTITVTTSSLSTGGVDPETSESIRFNAPLTFTSQNRAVTADDYAAIIKKSFANIDSISTWGGEDQDPPEYGRAYIAIKPLLSDTLTDDEKSQITGTILKGKNVVSITPEIVDPNFTHLELDVFFKYNPNLTDRSSTDLQTVVRDTIKDYNFNNLNKFDGVFRHSELARKVDNSDPSILNSTIRPRMFQTITPISTGLNNFNLSFTSPFFQTGASTNFILTSTAFKINGEDHFFGDIPLTGSTSRQVIVYRIVSGENVTVINNAGTVDVSNGKITLNSFQPDDLSLIHI